MTKAQGIEELQKQAERADGYLGEHVEPLVYDLIKLYAEGLQWTGAQVIEAILLNFAALATAQETLFGQTRDLFLPFVVDEGGRPVLGQELYAMLTRRYRADFLDSDHEAEKHIEQLERDRSSLSKQQNDG